MSKKNHDTTRIWKWSHDHRNDKKYRTAQAEGSRRYQEQLYRDAAFGRIARTLLKQLGGLFKELADKEEEIDAAVHAIRGKNKSTAKS